MFKKHDIFVLILVMRHVWTPFWTPNLLPFIESVQKRGSEKGPDTGRTDARTNERTDVTNGLTEYFWGLYTIALRAMIRAITHKKPPLLQNRRKQGGGFSYSLKNLKILTS